MENAGQLNKGLLLAMMEPPANLEEEFQDWYDGEHFPERKGCAGFETAGRFVCIEGWPRYLALYDLTNVDVLRGEAYSAIAVRRYSPWTHRIMSKVWGQFRAEGVQTYPGTELLGANGPCARLVLWRFNGVPAAQESSLADALRKLYGDRPETAQVRLFRVAQAAANDYIGLVELRGPGATADAALLGELGQHVDMVNTYVRYVRQAPGAFPASS